MRSQQVSVHGAVLHVAREGTGIPVLVPTGGGIPFYRNTFSARLKRELEFVYVEMRGTGGSTGTIAGATFATLAADLEAVRLALGLERTMVLGHSNHGCIALEHALAYPAGLAGTISLASTPDFSRCLVVGHARWEHEASAPARARMAELQAAFMTLPLAELSADEITFQRYLSLSPLGWRDLAYDVAAAWDGVAPRGMSDYFTWMAGAGATWNLIPRLPEIRMPVLAACGRYDYLCPAELWEEAAGTLPCGELAVFEGSAHNPQQEEGEAFDAALLDFAARAWAAC